MLEQRQAGASILEGDVRTRVRRELPRIDSTTLTLAIRSLSGSFLEVRGEHYGSSLRGLLASRWGMNAVDIVDHTLRLLRTMQEEPRPLRNFSWRRLLEASDLPYRTRNLAYLAITLTGLGSGLFPVDEDTCLGRGWVVPSDIDLLLESATTANAFVCERAHRATRATGPVSPRARDQRNAGHSREESGSEATVESFVFRELVRALVEVAKKPARVSGKDEDDITDLVELALGSLKEKFSITCNSRVGHGTAPGESGVVDLSICDRADGRIVVTGEAKRWDGQLWAREALHQIFGASARTESFLLILLYCQNSALHLCASTMEALLTDFFVPDGSRRLFAAAAKPADVTPPEERLVVRAFRSLHIVAPEVPSVTRAMYTVLVDLGDPAGKQARVTSPKAVARRRGKRTPGAKGE